MKHENSIPQPKDKVYHGIIKSLRTKRYTPKEIYYNSFSNCKEKNFSQTIRGYKKILWLWKDKNIEPYLGLANRSHNANR